MQPNNAPARSPEKSGRAARLWTYLGSSSAHKTALATVLVYRIWMFIAIGRVSELTGDETFYWRNTRELLHLLRIHTIPGRSFSEAVERIVGVGWFLPGMSVLAAPARVFSDDFVVARGWIAILGLGVLLHVSLRLRQMFSGQLATLFVVIVGVLPYTAWFSMTLWGGSIGGLLMLLNLLWALRLARRLRLGEPVSSWIFLALGGSVGFNVLVRPASLVQILPLALLLVFASIHLAASRQRLGTAVEQGIALIAGIVLVLAPWQIAVVNELGGPFFLVSSTPMNSILRYGDEAELADVGDSFLQLGRHLTNLADERGESLYAVTMAERDRIVGDVTVAERLRLIPISMHRYFAEENFFLGRALDQVEDAASTDSGIGSGLLVVNSVMWLALAVAVVHALVRRWHVWAADGLLGIVMRASFVALLYQPITRASHGRHINYMIPALIVFALLGAEKAGEVTELIGSGEQWPRTQRVVSSVFSLVVAGTLVFFFVS